MDGMTRSEEPIIVIGAGPAGLTAALELVRAGRRVTLLESDPEYVGGLARSARFGPHRLDIGGHRFYTHIEEIERWWREMLPGDLIEVERQSRIYYHGKFFNYPLRATDALRKLGLVYSARCGLSALWRRLRPIRPEVSFRDWVVNRFGDRLFHTFFESYTEKVWGMKCDAIAADWAAQRIQGLSLARAVAGAFGWSGRRRTLKTLIDRFHYPRLGAGMIWERAAERFVEAGGELLLGLRVVGIISAGAHVTEVVSIDTEGRRHRHPCGGVISSMPLSELVDALAPAAPPAVRAAAARLRYRDFLTVAVEVRREQLFTDQWIYIHDPSVRVGRIQNFRNWSAEMVGAPGVTVLGLEYFCFEDDAMWRMDDAALIALATEELERIGLVRADEVSRGIVVRMPKAYPIYDGHYKQALLEIRPWLAGWENLWSAGRNGMHQYNNQDHSMMTALLAARNLLRHDDRDPWRVTHEAEYLEERLVPRAVEQPAADL